MIYSLLLFSQVQSEDIMENCSMQSLVVSSVHPTEQLVLFLLLPQDWQTTMLQGMEVSLYQVISHKTIDRLIIMILFETADCKSKCLECFLWSNFTYGYKTGHTMDSLSYSSIPWIDFVWWNLPHELSNEFDCQDCMTTMDKTCQDTQINSNSNNHFTMKIPAAISWKENFSLPPWRSLIMCMKMASPSILDSGN